MTKMDKRYSIWKDEYEKNKGKSPETDFIPTSSGIQLKPIYTPCDWNSTEYDEKLSFPGQYPFTRGLYATMYRGQPWSKRQLVGLDTPEKFNERQLELLRLGQTAVNLIFCNSFYRGYDADMVNSSLVGTCGTPINTMEDMEIAMQGVPLDEISIGMNDPLGFTGAAMYLALADKRGIPYYRLSGTSNQSDFISHFVANHMFYRFSLEGSLRMLLDHVEFMIKNVPRWNPVSIVGQHMQQGGATPVQALAFTISTGIFYITETIKRGLDVDSFAPRFTFFFDVSINFFEEIAKFRAGRRIWAKLLKERFGAKDSRSMRFKFHAQTSGSDLTRQQPLNNIVRVTVQAMAAILGGTQSLHTDSYDEALGTPIEDAARVAIMTQNILAEESGIADVIDPIGGSYFIEKLTDEVESKAWEYINYIDSLGGMLKAVRSGYIQKEIGISAFQHQMQVEKNEKTVVGVNRYTIDEKEENLPPVTRPDPAKIQKHLERLADWKKNRNQDKVKQAMKGLSDAAKSPDRNIFAEVIAAVKAGATHGEIIEELRKHLGFGQPDITG